MMRFVSAKPPGTMADRRTLLLPVVIGKRELDANLLLGLLASEAGYRVLIGLRHSIDNTPRYGEALYLAKNVRQNFVTRLTTMVDSDNRSTRLRLCGRYTLYAAAFAEHHRSKKRARHQAADGAP